MPLLTNTISIPFITLSPPSPARKLHEFGHTRTNFNHNKHQGTVGFGLATSHVQSSTELESQRRRSVLDNLPTVPDRLLLQTQASTHNTYEKAHQRQREMTRPLPGVDAPMPVVKEINESVTFLKPTESFVHHVLMRPEEERTVDLQVNSPFGSTHRPVNHKYTGTVGFGLSSNVQCIGTSQTAHPPAVPDLQEGSHLLLQTNASRHNTYSAYKNKQAVEKSKHRKAFKKPSPAKGRRASMSSSVYTAGIKSSYRSKREIMEDIATGSKSNKGNRRHSFAHKGTASPRMTTAPFVPESIVDDSEDALEVEKESRLDTLQSLAGMASSPTTATVAITRPLTGKSTGKKLPGSARRVKTPATGLRRSARNTPADTVSALDTPYASTTEAQKHTPLMVDLDAEADAEQIVVSTIEVQAGEEETVEQQEFLAEVPAQRRSARKASQATPTPSTVSDLSLLLQSSEKLIDIIDSTVSPATNVGSAMSARSVVRRSAHSARNTPQSTATRRSARKSSARSTRSKQATDDIDAAGTGAAMTDILDEHDDDTIYKTEEEWEAEFAAQEAAEQAEREAHEEAERVALEQAKVLEVEKLRLLEEEKKAERLRVREAAREAEIIRLEAEAKEAERLRLEQEEKQLRLLEQQKADAERIRVEAEKEAQREAVECERMRIEQERKSAEILRLKEEARQVAADAERIRLENEAKAERMRLREEARAVEQKRLEDEARETARLQQEAEEAETLRLQQEEAEVVRLREAAREAERLLEEKQAAEASAAASNEEEDSMLEEALFAPQDVPVKRGRGRPRKSTTPGKATPKTTPGVSTRKKKGVAFADSVTSTGKGKTATPLRRGTPHSKSKSIEGKSSKDNKSSPEVMTPLTAVTTRSRRRESVRIDVDSLAAEVSVLLAESPLVPHLKRAQMDVSMISPPSAGPSPAHYSASYNHSRNVLGSVEKSEMNARYCESIGSAVTGRLRATPSRRRSVCPDINDIVSPGTPYVPTTRKSSGSSASKSTSTGKAKKSTPKSSKKSTQKDTPTRRSARNKENGDSLANILTDINRAK